MQYVVILHSKVEAFLAKHPEVKARFDEAMDEIEGNPRLPAGSNKDIEAYKKGWKDHFRLRIGKYRFLYEVKEHKIEVYFYDAGSRWDIY